MLVKTFTTEGMAFFAAALMESTCEPTLGIGADASRIVNPGSLCELRQVSQSGLKITTTKSTPSAMVVLCAKTSQNFRIIKYTYGLKQILGNYTGQTKQ
ncbi:MAG: hypothetical protein ABIP04_15385 [Sulfuriferula sp.]